MAMGTNDNSRLDEIFKKANRSDDMIVCNFCGKKSEEVKQIVVRDKVAICNECVEVCNGILKENRNAIQKPKNNKLDYSEIILANPKAFVDSLSLEAAQQLQLELIEFYRIMNTLVCKLDDNTKS